MVWSKGGELPMFMWLKRRRLRLLLLLIWVERVLGAAVVRVDVFARVDSGDLV